MGPQDVCLAIIPEDLSRSRLKDAKKGADTDVLVELVAFAGGQCTLSRLFRKCADALVVRVVELELEELASHFWRKRRDAELGELFQHRRSHGPGF